jgi:uncharacterized protein (TIGR03435 family)
MRLILASVGVASVVTTLAGQTIESPRFEVASVKTNKSGGLTQAGARPEGDHVTATNATLRQLIQAAYNIGTDSLIGGPSWINRDRFDLIAKAPALLSGNEWRLMLRTLLADRFKLAAHRETRKSDMFALTLARRDRSLGPNLRPAQIDCASLRAQSTDNGDPCGQRSLGNALMVGKASIRGMGIDSLLGTVARDAGRPVVDRTGLTGAFDWDLTWTPLTNRRPGIDPDGPTIFTALQEQLGLKLEGIKGTTDVLVIDRVERPTED